MFRRQSLISLVVLLLVSELIAFMLVAHALGFGTALLLTVSVSLFGALQLRRLGSAAIAGLRGMTAGRRAPEDAFVDGALNALGAFLLVVPGFLTDLVGLALLAPSGRRWARARINVAGLRAPRPRVPGVVDLAAGDWTRRDTIGPD